MITKEMVDRINFLSRKSKAEGLTDEEKTEQQKLRREYIDFIKMQVKDQLDCIEFVEDKDCSCGGHNHKHDENCGCKDHHAHKHGKDCSCGHQKH